MMTPKEKAEELVDKYTIIISSSRGRCGMLKALGVEAAKKCALIEVDDILNIRSTQYYREVKQEIEKL